MDRSQEPADRDEAYAEMREDDLGIRDENWMTAETNTDNQRVPTEGETDPEPGSPSDAG
jgi:hypothetical protein